MPCVSSAKCPYNHDIFVKGIINTFPSRKRAQPLPREDALKLFPTGTTVAKESDSEIIRGQVYDYRAPYWRVQYEDNDWEQPA